MASLTNNTIQSTYDGLLKLADNDPISATPKAITDGLGNDTSMTLDNAGNLVVGSIAVSGGLISEFIKADGSLDSSIYLTSETDPVFTASPAGGITNTDINNWDTAFSWGDHAGLYATQLYVNNQISDLIDSAPATLDTLNELAAALGDDDDFAGTMTTALAGKANLAHTHNFSELTDFTVSSSADDQLLSYDSGSSQWINKNITDISGYNNTNWDTAYNERLDYSTQGYITSLADAPDTAITTPANNQGLLYNSTTSKWENSTFALSNFYVDGLSFNPATGVLEASVNGTTNQTTGLDGRYSLTTHTHTNATTVSDGFMSASDKTKLDGIEAGANVTDTANVTSAGALMDSEVTNLVQVKTFDSSDYATAAQGILADSAQQPPSEGAFVDGDKTKLDGIETGADDYGSFNITDVTNTASIGSGDSITFDGAGDVEVTVDSSLKRVTIDVTNTTARTDEEIRDVIGATLVGGDNVTVLVDDPANTINISSAQLTDAQVRSKISGTGLINYNSTTGVISTTANNFTYTHPSHPGDDINIDTTPLTGATVISDLDFNVTTDIEGHVTDANGTVATRNLTLGDLGYTGATNANNYVHPSYTGDDINIDTTPLTGATVISDLDLNVTTNTLGHVTDANGSVATRTLTLADLGYTGATNANNYVHPTFNGDDFSVDTGALTGATVVSDIDINITTDSNGHVTDANGSVATRTLTLLNLGYTGDTNANNYVLPTNLAGDDINIDTGALTGATVISDLDFNITTNTSGLVTDANGTVATRTLTLADLGYTGATNANNYVHPTHPGDDLLVDSGALSGTSVISDINFNVTTDTLGHVTDANGTIATRNLSLLDLGYTGATDANKYVHPTHPGDDISIDTLILTGATVISELDFNITTDTLGHVTDANGTVSTKTLTLADLGYTGDTDATNNIGDITEVVAGTGMTGGGTSGSVTLNCSITNNNQLTNGAGYTTNTGTVTSVSTGTGLDGSFTTSGTITLDLSELTDMTAAMIGTDEFIVLDAGAERRKAANEIPLSIFNNDSGFTSNAGDITGVTAGTGLSGGGTSGSVTLDLATAGFGAGTYGSTANGTKIDQITLDAYGRVTGITTGGTGDITGVTAGTGLSGGGTAGGLTVDLDVGSSGSWFSKAAYVASDGVMEVGKYIDFHNSNIGVSDNDGRIETDGAGKITVTGNLHSTGTITAAGDVVAYFSDKRLKTEIKPITDALTKLKEINGYTYKPNALAESLGVQFMNTQAGLMAQEVEKVFPEIVRNSQINSIIRDKGIEDLEEVKTLQYERMVPLLVEAVKELNEKVEVLESKLNNKNVEYLGLLNRIEKLENKCNDCTCD